jgi:membrane protein DedA with SNARE-associated domain
MPAESFLIEQRYPLLFGAVLAEQLGLPLPAAPLLLSAGALAGMGKLDFAAALALSGLASLAADLAWYEAGRRRGGRILAWLCRLSLEPDSCVRRTEDAFARHGARTLLVAKFVPGLSTIAPPLAGIAGMTAWRFAAWDGAGALLWAGTYLALGVVFERQIEAVARGIEALGGDLLGAGGVLLLAWLALKWLQRRRFLRRLRVARITPEELKSKIDGREPVVVVDLRHHRDFDADPVTVPGALRLSTDELQQRHLEIPRDRDIVLYCT